MRADNYKIGKRIKHKETNAILEVIELNGKKVWEETKWGDIYNYVDEDLYIELN